MLPDRVCVPHHRAARQGQAKGKTGCRGRMQQREARRRRAPGAQSGPGTRRRPARPPRGPSNPAPTPDRCPDVEAAPDPASMAGAGAPQGVKPARKGQSPRRGLRRGVRLVRIPLQARHRRASLSGETRSGLCPAALRRQRRTRSVQPPAKTLRTVCPLQRVHRTTPSASRTRTPRPWRATRGATGTSPA